MQLFFTPEITLPLYTLPEDESKHCVRVLRLSAGDILSLTDGRGNLYTAMVVTPDPKRCTVEITHTEQELGKLPYKLTIAVAPTKNTDRYEWLLEKATEIGVEAVVPLDCRHSERHTLNAERVKKIVAGAMKQSLKAYLPRVEPMTPFPELVRREFDGVKLIAHCHPGDKAYIPDVAPPGRDVMVMIGPEGDFSPEEVAQALENGFKAVSLGNSRLRTETAALMAVAEVSIINRKK